MLTDGQQEHPPRCRGRSAAIFPHHRGFVPLPGLHSHASQRGGLWLCQPVGHPQGFDFARQWRPHGDVIANGVGHFLLQKNPALGRAYAVGGGLFLDHQADFFSVSHSQLDAVRVFIAGAGAAADRVHVGIDAGGGAAVSLKHGHVAIFVDAAKQGMACVPDVAPALGSVGCRCSVSLRYVPILVRNAYQVNTRPKLFCKQMVSVWRRGLVLLLQPIPL